MPRISYVNGRYVPHAEASVHVEDRGFQFSDSVYEMISLMDGQLADARGHLDRLERSLSELRIPMPMTRGALQMVIAEVVRRNRLRNAAIYIQVSRGAAPRDFPFPKSVSPTLAVIVRPMNFDVSLRKAAGKKVITMPDIRWQRRDIKTTGLLAQVLCKQAALDKGAFDAWMFDEKGFITEASASNAWIVNKKGELLTRPTANHNILKGVTRSALQDICKKAGIRIVERPFSVKEAHAAVEAFATGASSVVTPIVAIDGKKIGSGKIGPVTEKIFDLYMEYAARKGVQLKWNAK